MTAAFEIVLSSSLQYAKNATQICHPKREPRSAAMSTLPHLPPTSRSTQRRLPSDPFQSHIYGGARFRLALFLFILVT